VEFEAARAIAAAPRIRATCILSITIPPYERSTKYHGCAIGRERPPFPRGSIATTNSRWGPGGCAGSNAVDSHRPFPKALKRVFARISEPKMSGDVNRRKTASARGRGAGSMEFTRTRGRSDEWTSDIAGRAAVSPDARMSRATKPTAASDVQQWRRSDFLAGSSQNERLMEYCLNRCKSIAKGSWPVTNTVMFLSF
jgi:hypothetical protein